jgi:hypothetical protein
MLKQSLNVILALSFIATVAHGQSTPKIEQNSNKSVCSNIVALTGDVHINCSSLTPEQKKTLDTIPAILRKILANEIDPKTVMEKLDEILAAASRQATPSVAQSNSGGINIQQGTTGADSPIINSPITVGNIPKAISVQDMVVFKKYFLGAKSKAKIKISADQFSGAVPLPDDFYDALKGGGWTMVDAGVIQVMAFSAPGKRFQGAVVTINGEPLPEGQLPSIDTSDPLFYIGNALEALKIPHGLNRNKTQPEGVISISFQGGFPN